MDKPARCPVRPPTDGSPFCLSTGVLLPLLLLLPAAAQAQSPPAAWPTKPLRLIVPSGPVGPSDFLARALGNQLSEFLKVTVVIDNRPGAGGTLGTMLTARAAPDGHTILVMGLNNYVINASLYPKLPYDSHKDLLPVSVLAEAPLLIATHPSLPVKNVQQLVALAKKQSRGLDYASGGAGTGPHLAMELFLDRVGVKMEHIAYKGAGAALNEVIGRQVGVIMVNMTAGITFVRAGKLRGIAVTSAKRSRGAPEIPTVAESGYPDYITTGQHFAMVPGATPREVVARVHQELMRALNTNDVRERLAAEGSEIVGSSTEQAITVVRDEIARWSKVIARLGLSAN